MSKLLHNKCTSEFYKKSYVDVIDFHHLEGTQVKIDKLELSDTGEETETSFWGYVFKKGEKKYLLSAYDEDQKEINLDKVLPIIPKDVRKVASKGVAYWEILDSDHMAIRAQKYMPLKEAFDLLTDMEHTNPDHYRMWASVVLSQWFERVNFRVATPKSFGKSTFLSTLGSLGLKVTSIAKPNRPKLELLTKEKVAYIDEICDMQKSPLEDITTFLLSATDDKPQVQKQTRAYGNVGETLFVDDWSCGMIYNDVDHYPSTDNYLDYRVNEALLDRFLPLRFYGKFTEEFTDISFIDVEKFVKENTATYVKIIRTLQYYKENLIKELNGYDLKPEVYEFGTRHKNAIISVLKVWDVMCDSQEEFDKMQDTLIKANKDYFEMLEHMPIRRKVLKHFDEYKTSEDEKKRDKYKQIVESIKSTEPYRAKTALCFELLKGDQSTSFAKVENDRSWFEQ